MKPTVPSTHDLELIRETTIASVANKLEELILCTDNRIFYYDSTWSKTDMKMIKLVSRMWNRLQKDVLWIPIVNYNNVHIPKWILFLSQE